MKKCTSCSRASRKLQRALVLDGPGAVRRGLVCAACASTGWLFVFAGEREEKQRRKTLDAIRNASLIGVAVSLAGK